MDASQKYLFDTLGYVVVRGALSADEVAAANAAIDRRRESELHERARTPSLRLSGGSKSLEGDGKTGRVDCGTVLSWPSPDGDVFRRLLAHPSLVPYVNDLCCPGYRLDHSPLLIVQQKGAEGFELHGGNLGATGEWNYQTAYVYQGERCHNFLLNMSIALTDNDGSSGGFAVLPGSHKSNLAPPGGLRACEPEYMSMLQRPALKAGDAILFSEGTLHGTLPWTGEDERRAVFFRFTMPTHAYARGYTEGWPEDVLDKVTDEQRVVLEPPYAVRLNRNTLRAPTDGGDVERVVAQPRDPKKVEFDETVFKRAYF
eukprot:PRCOL_00000757-RA